MSFDKNQLALEFLLGELADRGYNADEVFTATGALKGLSTLRNVRLKTGAILNDGPVSRLGIYAVESKRQFFPNGATNSLGHAGERDEAAKRYFDLLSRRIGYTFEHPDGTMVNAYGNPETNGIIFAAQSTLILPSGKPMHVNISIRPHVI